MCIQWTRVLYSVVITRQSNPPIAQFNSLCNEFWSVLSMFVYNIHGKRYVYLAKQMFNPRKICVGGYIGITLSVSPSIFLVSATSPNWMDRY